MILAAEPFAFFIYVSIAEKEKSAKRLGGFEFEFASPTRDLIGQSVARSTGEIVFVSHVHEPSDGSAWEVKYDSTCSLGRSPDSPGGELVSPAVSFPKGLCIAVAKAVDAIVSVGGTVDARCGFHVHISGLDAAEAALFLGLWAWIEQCFVEAMPPCRRRNPFCQLVSRTHDFVALGPEAFCSLARESLSGRKTIAPLRNAKWAASLYHFKKRGTVECRLMEATTDVEDLVGWMTVLGALVETSARGFSLPRDPELATLSQAAEVLAAADSNAAEWLFSRVARWSPESIATTEPRESF